MILYRLPEVELKRFSAIYGIKKQHTYTKCKVLVSTVLPCMAQMKELQTGWPHHQKVKNTCYKSLGG